MKQEILSFIDRLASKELTWGCMFTDNQFDRGVVACTKCNAEKVFAFSCMGDKHNFGMEMTAREEYKYKIYDAEEFQTFKIIGHPILIGDVLEKIDKADISQEVLRNAIKPKVYASVSVSLRDRYLVGLWRACGLTKSLQSIFEEAEWMEEAVWYAGAPTGDSIIVPKQNPIRELFQFLLQLGL